MRANSLSNYVWNLCPHASSRNINLSHLSQLASPISFSIPDGFTQLAESDFSKVLPPLHIFLRTLWFSSLSFFTLSSLAHYKGYYVILTEHLLEITCNPETNPVEVAISLPRTVSILVPVTSATYSLLFWINRIASPPAPSWFPLIKTGVGPSLLSPNYSLDDLTQFNYDLLVKRNYPHIYISSRNHLWASDIYVQLFTSPSWISQMHLKFNMVWDQMMTSLQIQ